MLMVLILGGSVHTVQKNTEVIFVANKKIGLEVKTKFMVMYRDENVGRDPKFLWKCGRIQIFGNKLLTYLLNSWSRVLEKLTGFQLVKKFPVFYGTRKFITSFTSARHLSLPWARSVKSIPPTSHILKIYLNIILPSTPVSSMWSLANRFPNRNPACISSFLYTGMSLHDSP